METQERYQATECPENGRSAAPDAAEPAPRVRCRLEEITVQVKYVWEQEIAGDWVAVRALPFNPTRLFADPSESAMPYGAALEKLIQAGKQQAENQ